MALVPYNPVVAISSTQRQRIAAADGGDCNARLELLPDTEVEQRLRRTYIDGDNISVLEALQRLDTSGTQAERLKHILEALAERTEDAAVTTALVIRYADIHRLWETDVDCAIRSKAAFLDSLDSSAVVKVNLVIGASTEASRRGSLRIIEKSWGQDWWDRLDSESMPSPSIATPFTAPKRLLLEIAANCKRGLSIEEAQRGWAAARQRRLDPEHRKRDCPRASKSQYIVNRDVASLNQGVTGGRNHRIDESCSLDLQEDRFEFRSLQPVQQTKAAGPTKVVQKRRKTGKKEARIKRILPIDDSELGDDREDSSSVISREEPGASTNGSGGEHTMERPLPRCIGPEIERALRQLQGLLMQEDTCCLLCADIVEGIQRLDEWIAAVDSALQSLHDIDSHPFRTTE